MKKLLKFLFIKIPLTLLALSLFSVLVFKWIPVWYTPLMVRRAIEYSGDDSYHFQRKWTSIENISPNMIKSVVASEDNLFNTNNGFAWEEIRKEIELCKKTGKKPRGCSTISQQTAKNVFTLGDRSFLRKGVETYFTFLIEKIWGKKRIMEVYLNVAEMGKGVYGAEAAAKKYFGVRASKLSLYQAALIAASLPNPRKRNPGNPSSYMSGRASTIASLTGKIEYSFIKEWREGK